MENNIKPIKRSRQLAPLSREHHNGLLFSWKLRQGLDNGTELETLRQFCHWYWKEHIRKHFRDEENVLLKYLPVDSRLSKQLMEEHNNIRELIISIDRKPDTITIDMLADFITRHIRFEERVMFKYLEENLSEAQLDEILSQLSVDEAVSKEWTDVFWERRGN